MDPKNGACSYFGFQVFFSYRPGWCDRRRAPFGSRLRLRLYTWVSHSLCRCGGCTSILTPSNASKTPPGQYGLAHLKTTAMYSYRHKVCDQTIIYKYKNTLFLPWWKIIIGEGTTYLSILSRDLDFLFAFWRSEAPLHPLQAVNYHVTVKKVHLIPLSNFWLMSNSVRKRFWHWCHERGLIKMMPAILHTWDSSWLLWTVD